MDTFLKRWLDEARKLLPWWQAILLVLVAALMKVLIQVTGEKAALVWDLIRRIHIDVEPSPPPISDGERPGEHDVPAQEGGGPPGGGPTGGMGA